MNLFGERGIDATSVDTIAVVSGVSKATIYKHWPDKGSLCLEVLGYIHGLDEKPPVFDSGDFRADLIARLRYEPAGNRKAMRDSIWPHLMTYSAGNPSFGSVWRAKFIEPARMEFAAIIKRGERQGVLRPGIDPEVGIALLLGPLMYRHVFMRGLGAEVPKELETQIVDAFLATFGTSEYKSTAKLS